MGGSHGFQGNGGGSVVRGTTELTANELPTKGDRTNFKELYGRSGKFDRDTAKILQTLLTPPPPRRGINDCSLMQINVSYATFTDISSINLNSLSLIRVVRIVKKKLFLSYKTS